jgi:hypothetical protein
MYAKLLKRVVGFGLVPWVLTVAGVLPLTRGWTLIGLANVGGIVAYASGGRAIPGSDVKPFWHDDEEDPLERRDRIGLFLYFLTVCVTAAALLVARTGG